MSAFCWILALVIEVLRESHAALTGYYPPPKDDKEQQSEPRDKSLKRECFQYRTESSQAAYEGSIPSARSNTCPNLSAEFCSRFCKLCSRSGLIELADSCLRRRRASDATANDPFNLALRSRAAWQKEVDGSTELGYGDWLNKKRE